MTDIIVRRAKIADLPACANIVNDVIDEMDWFPRTQPREDIAALFQPEILSRRTLLVAIIDDAVGGYLSLHVPENFVRGLYLAPHARRHGAGRALTDAAKIICPQQLELGVLEPNIAAQHFYRAQGFQEIPEGRKQASETDESVPELLMRWEAQKP